MHRNTPGACSGWIRNHNGHIEVRLLAAQPARFATRHRALLGQPGGDALVGAVIVADHTWFLAHIKNVLGAGADEASNRLWFGLQALNAVEAARLRAEIEGQRAQLGDTYVQGLVDTIDGEAEALRDRAGALRWPAVAVVP